MALGDLVPLTASGSSSTASTPPAGAASTTASVATPPVTSITSVTSVSSTSVPPPPPIAELERVVRYVKGDRSAKCRRYATRRDLWTLLVYLIAWTAFTLYSLYCLWPRPTPSEQAPSPAVAPLKVGATQPPPTDTTRRAPVTPQPQSPPLAVSRDSVIARHDSVVNPCDAVGATTVPTRVIPDSVRAQMTGICYFARPYFIWKERQLLLLVLLAGALGGLTTGMRKSTRLFYNGDLCAEGLPGIYTWPVYASLIALVFYAFIRGGFFSGQSTVGQTSTYSFIATALLAGMFTPEAYEKLRKVAVSVLEEVPATKVTPPTESTTSSPSATSRGQTGPTPGATRSDGERGVLPSTPPPPAATVPPPGTVG